MGMSDFDDERWVPDEALASLSLEQEYDPEETHVERAKRLLTENVDVAAASMIWMARNSQTERIRLEAGREILARVLGRAGDAPATGTLDDLFNALDKMNEHEAAFQQSAPHRSNED
jgi:hypothetical protein